MTVSESKRKLLALLGLANRAGKLAVGASAIEGVVRKGRNPLIVIAVGIGDVQYRKLKRLKPVSGFIEGVVDRGELAQVIGRRELVAVALSDSGFVKGIAKLDFVECSETTEENGDSQRR